MIKIYKAVFISEGSSLLGSTYYGQTVDIPGVNYFGNGKVIKDYIKKYGRDGVCFTVISQTTDKKHADALEIFFIKRGKERDTNCVNVLSGGDVGARGYKWTEEQKRKGSEKQTARWQDAEARRKQSRTQKIAQNRRSSKRKNSETHKKSWEDPDTRIARTEAIRKARNKPEKKKQQSEISKSEWKDPIKRQKRIEALKASWSDPERKRQRVEKMRLSRSAKS